MSMIESEKRCGNKKLQSNINRLFWRYHKRGVRVRNVILSVSAAEALGNLRIWGNDAIIINEDCPHGYAVALSDGTVRDR